MNDSTSEGTDRTLCGCRSLRSCSLTTTLALTLTLLAVGTLPTLAQSTDQPRLLTLEETISIALENNYQLKQAANNLSVSRAQELSSMADLLPNLNAGMNRSRNVGRQFDNTTGDFGDFTINSFGASLSSNLDLFTGMSNINSIRASRQRTLSREEFLNRARENVIFATASGYLQYLLNIELLDIARRNLEVSQQQLERIRAQVEVGTRPLADRLNQESTVATNEFQVINRENAVRQARLSLIRQIQIDPQEPVDFVRPELPDATPAPKEYDLQMLIETALDSRSDLKSEEASIEAAFYAYQAARGSQLPSLSANASFRSSLNDRNPSSYQDQFFDQNISRNLSLSLSIPIFNRMNIRTNVLTQRINYENAQLSLDNSRLEIIQEVNQAYDDYLARIAEVESTQKAFAAAERAFETERQRYEIGASTLIEFSQAQALLVQAQSNRIQALYSYIFQEKLLDYYLGVLQPELSLGN